MPNYGVNRDLPPLPPDDEVVGAVRAEVQRNLDMMEAAEHRYFKHPAPSANDIAHRLGIAPARRAGSGAVKGSWSGFMSPALRIAPRLVALTKRGVLVRTWERGRYTYEVAGEEWWRRG